MTAPILDFASAAVPRPGSALLYSASTPLERAMADISADELLTINAELIVENWDPWLVQTKNLPYLAWALGVGLWRDHWPIEAKRSWVARQWEFKAYRGTRKAYEMALEQMTRGGQPMELLDVVAPPQRAFASRRITAEQRRIWLSFLPQLRLYFRRTRGHTEDRAFAGSLTAAQAAETDPPLPTGLPAFAGHCWARPDVARRLIGRKAYLYEPLDGTETALQTYDIEKEFADKREPYEQRVIIPGKAWPQTPFATARAYADRSYAVGGRYASRAITYSIGQAYVDPSAELRVTTTPVGWEPVDTTSERVPVRAVRPGMAFANRDYADKCYAQANDAALAFYDRLYLNAPGRPMPLLSAVSYANHARVGMIPYTAWLLIRARRTASEKKAFADRFAGSSFARKDDPSFWKDATDAVRHSKALRDTILVDFRTTRTLQLADTPLLDGSRHLDQRLPRERF